MAAAKKQPYLLLSASNVTSTYHSPQKDHRKEGRESHILEHEVQTVDEQSSSEELHPNNGSKRSGTVIED